MYPRTTRFLLLPLLLFMLFSGCDDSNLVEPDSAASSSGISGADDVAAKRGAPSESDGYIVVFKDEVGNPAAEAEGLTRSHGGSVGFVYRNVIKGFSVRGLPDQALEALRRSPRVAYVESDDVVRLSAQTVPTGVQRIFADENANVGINGADDARIDVDVAIIDTGIDFEHPDLNVVGGVDCTVSSGGGAPWRRSYFCSETEGTGGDDDHYHGTHVGGTVAALDNGIGVVGVAPGARLWAVKVLDSGGSGYESGILAGIDWVGGHGEIEVANMSLGGSGFSQAEYDAIQNAVSNGVAFAVAAGNDNDNASNYSPAAFDNALTVSALADFNGEPGGGAPYTCRSDQDDTLADFSNFGSAVDIAAPGVCILSTFPIEQGEYGSISGTSMASPHVAGALALLASSNPASDASGVYGLYDDVINAGNTNWTDDSGDGTTEPLLDVSDSSLFNPTTSGGGGGTPNSPPSVTVSSPSDGSVFQEGASISFAGSASDAEDGDITPSLSWASSLDGSIGAGAGFSAVLSVGTHTISASVTDSEGAGGSASISVVVEPADTGGTGITLTATGFKDKGRHHADLTWSGATSAEVDVLLDGFSIATETDTGSFTWSSSNRGGASYTFQVCEAGTDTCSNEAVVAF